MSDKLLYNYYLRLKTEGFLKALLWGLAIGFGALTVLGMLYWIKGWQSAWVCLLVWAAVSAGATFAFYNWRFKPTTKYIARRVDDLGLHERILTMTELQGDDSYIAQMQRADALRALSTIRVELLKIGVSTPSIITAAASMVLGVFSFLFAAGVFISFADINPVIPVTYEITYAVKEGEGTIEGELKQKVAVGERTEAVVAVPADGWRFLKWTDEKGVPYRSDEVVRGNKTYLAVFVEMDLGLINGLPNDKPDDAPGDGEDEGQGNDEQQDNSTPPPDKYEEVNQIIDGETYYGSVYEEAYKDALDKLADEKYNQDQKEIANGYFDNIEQGDNENEDNN